MLRIARINEEYVISSSVTINVTWKTSLEIELLSENPDILTNNNNVG